MITTWEPAGADPPHGHQARSDPDAPDIEVDNRPAWSDRDRLLDDGRAAGPQGGDPAMAALREQALKSPPLATR